MSEPLKRSNSDHYRHHAKFAGERRRRKDPVLPSNETAGAVVTKAEPKAEKVEKKAPAKKKGGSVGEESSPKAMS